MTTLVLDTPELARKYEVVSDKQFEHGKLLIADLAVQKGEKVLDVGSGTGRLTAYVSDIVGDTGVVIGVDPLPFRIEIAQQKSKYKQNLNFAVAGAEDLSQFADEQFDVVYLNSVFHWLADKPLALKEIYRVLKPNGRLAITAAAQEQPHTLQLLIDDLFTQEPFKHFADNASSSPQFKLSISQTRDLLNAANFQVVSSEIKTFVDHFNESHDVIDFSTSSSFGNFLSTLPELIRDQALVNIQLALEQFRTAKGIQLARHLIFTYAVKQPA